MQMEEGIHENNRIFKYSVYKLIELVKVRPIIWDSSRVDFRNLNNKDKAWKEVYEALDSKYRSSDERTQAEIGMKITAKWRNIRDAFIRSFKKRAKQGNVKKYMHHDRLSFMIKLLIAEDTAQNPQRRYSSNSLFTSENITEESSSFEDGEDPLITIIKVEPDENYSGDCKIDDKKLTCTYENTLKLKRKGVDFDDENYELASSKVQRVDMEIENQPTQTEDDLKTLSLLEGSINVFREEKNTSLLPPDEDESFFASILSSVRDMTSDEKLEFRMGVLQLICETRQNRRLSAAKQLNAGQK